MTFDEIVKTLNPSARVEIGGQEPLGYSIDSRSVRNGELFFAIRGETNDGHQFVADAIGRGALSAVVSREWAATANIDAERLIPVDDTLEALKTLASMVVRKWSGRLIAITGSMGKTTTKELTAAVLTRDGRVMKTGGNLNNAYGLPLSILKMETDGAHASDFQFGVFEMGMNHRGELAELAAIAPPDLAVVTNVAPVHLEYFSSVDEIAEAKAELVSGVKPRGAAVLNADDQRTARMGGLRDDIGIRTFGVDQAADVMARDVRTEGIALTRFKLATGRGEVDVALRLGGRHNVYNALAAAAVGEFYDVALNDIADAFAEASTPKMRGQVHEFKAGFTVIDDSYNSNPNALIEMVSTICGVEGYKRRVIVAGEMLELGSNGPELHRDAGSRIASARVDFLIGVRGLARELVEGAREAGLSAEAAVFCETPDEAAELLKKEIRAGDLILVKGSRGVRTDIVVGRIRQWMEGEADNANHRVED